jgi:hypothetical protein
MTKPEFTNASNEDDLLWKTTRKSTEEISSVALLSPACLFTFCYNIYILLNMYKLFTLKYKNLQFDISILLDKVKLNPPILEYGSRWAEMVKF